MESTKNKRIEINDLLEELLNSGKGDVHDWELLISLPALNQFQVLSRGIRDAIQSKNYICAASLMRSLLESTMVFIYDSTAQKYDEEEYYSQFISHKRLRRWSKSKKKWEHVRDEHLVKQFEDATKIKISDFYNMMCNVLHFSFDHSRMLVSSDKSQDEVTFSIGEIGPSFDKDSYDRLSKMTEFLKEQVKLYLAVAVKKKREYYKDIKSEISEEVLKGREIKDFSSPKS